MVLHLLYLLLFVIGNAMSTRKKEIVVGFMHPSRNEQKEDIIVEIAANVAARLVSPLTLENYTIRPIKVPFGHLGNIGYMLLSTLRMKTMFDLADGIKVDADKMIAIIGPINTAYIEVVNPFMVKSNILELNHDAGGVILTSTKRFPHLINIATPITVHIRSAITLLKHMKWLRIAVIFTNTGSSKSEGTIPIVQSFERLAKASGINIEYSKKLFYHIVVKNDPTEMRRALKTIKEKDIRIIVLFTNEVTMKTILCEGVKQGLYGPKYIYLNAFGELVKDWIIDKFNYNCSREQFLEIKKNILLLSRHARAPGNTVTFVNTTVSETMNMINEEIKKKNITKFVYPQSIPYICDAIWGLAASLRNILKRDSTFLDTFSNSNKSMKHLEILSEEYANINFQGASGWINFTTVGDKRYRDGLIALRKYKKNNTGYPNDPFDGIGIIGFENVEIDTSQLYFKIPLDRPKEIKNILTLPTPLVIALWTISGCGILMSLFFLFVNIIWRNVTFLKLSSPNINSLICVGCVLSYTAAIFYGFDSQTIKIEHMAATCNASSLLLSMGFTLIFGSLFSKTWRIYRIFTKSQAARYVVIKDFHLFSIVLFLLVIDIIIFFVQIFVSPFRLTEKVLKEVPYTDKDTIERDIIHKCSCEYQSQILLAMFIYKGILMLFGLFVAYETRSIKIAAINDSSYIGAAVYNSSLFVTLGAILVYALYDTERYKESYIVFSLCTLQVTTITLCLVFVPKIFMLITKYDDPNFKNGRPVINEQSNSEYFRSDVSVAGDTIGRRWHQQDSQRRENYGQGDNISFNFRTSPT